MPTPTPQPPLVAHQSIQFEHRLGRSLNEFFESFLRTTDGKLERADLDTLWTENGLRVPEGYSMVGFVSRRTFRYPYLALQFNKLPDEPNQDGAFNVGFSTHEAPWLTWFRVARTWGYSFWAGGKMDYGETSLNVLMPPDYASAWHIYEIKVNRQNVELFIGGDLKGVILLGVQEPVPKSHVGPAGLREWGRSPPYVLDAARQGLPAELTVWVQLKDPDRKWTIDFNPGRDNMLVAYDGDPSPPRVYAHYSENTSIKWNGLVTEAQVISHPVPVWGYARKTLLFQSNAAGLLTIQVYAGGDWRTVDTLRLSPDTLTTYNLDIEAPIARSLYAPAGKDTIAVAEWHLAG